MTTSCSRSLQAAVWSHNVGVDFLQQAQYAQASSSFRNALEELKDALRFVDEDLLEKTESRSSMGTYYDHCPYILIPSGLRMTRTGVSADIPSIFQDAFYIAVDGNHPLFLGTHSSRLGDLLTGTILLNTAIVHHLKNSLDDLDRSRCISPILYPMAAQTLLTYATNLNRKDHGLLLHDNHDRRNNVFIRFAIMVALNNALVVTASTTEADERLQELFQLTDILYPYSSPVDGSLIPWHEEDALSLDEEGRTWLREWDVVFRRNAETMQLKSLGFLQCLYTASAA